MAELDLSRFSGFEWDSGNLGKNWVKHKVSETESEQAFFNEPALFLDDKAHSAEEPRTLLLGKSDAGRLLSVVFTIRGSLLRVISARDMNHKERELFRHA